MAGPRDDGSFAEDRAHHPGRKVGRVLGKGAVGAILGHAMGGTAGAVAGGAIWAGLEHFSNKQQNDDGDEDY